LAQAVRRGGFKPANVTIISSEMAGASPVTWVCSRETLTRRRLDLLHLAPIGCMLLAQALLQGSQVLFTLMLNPLPASDALLLKSLCSRLEVLPYVPRSLQTEPAPVVRPLQFLRHMLPELILGFAYLLPDGLFRCLQHLL